MINLMPKKLMLITSLCGCLCVAAPASARDLVNPLGDQIAAAYKAKQNKHGQFPDYVKSSLGSRGRDTYSESMMGAALLRWGLQRKRTDWVLAGAKALRWSFRNPAARGRISRILEDMALVDAYLFAAPRLRHKRWRSLLVEWRKRLAYCYIDSRMNKRSMAENQNIIQALTALSLIKLNIGKPARGSVLADKTRTRAIALNYLKSYAAKYAGHTGPQLIGDPPAFPLAYHLLSAALLQRVMDHGYARQLPTVKTLINQAQQAVSQLSPPNGRLAYSGRSADQSWSIGMGVYLARKKGGAAGATLNTQALQSLERQYRSRSWGIWMLPAMSQNTLAGLRTLDSYASAVPYGGLTLLSLSWSKGTAAPKQAEQWPTESKQIIQARGTPMAQIATQRSGPVWFAIRGGNMTVSDGRLAPGLLSLQMQQDGAWHEVLAGRPSSTYLDHKQGPLLVSSGEPNMAAYESSPSIDWVGRLALAGYYRRAGSKHNLLRMREYFIPHPCGLEIQVQGASGYQVQLQLPAAGTAVLMDDQHARWSKAELYLTQGRILSIQPGPPTSLHVVNSLIRMASDQDKDLIAQVLIPGCQD